MIEENGPATREDSQLPTFGSLISKKVYPSVRLFFCLAV